MCVCIIPWHLHRLCPHFKAKEHQGEIRHSQRGKRSERGDSIGTSYDKRAQQARELFNIEIQRQRPHLVLTRTLKVAFKSQLTHAQTCPIWAVNMFVPIALGYIVSYAPLDKRFDSYCCRRQRNKKKQKNYDG